MEYELERLKRVEDNNEVLRSLAIMSISDIRRKDGRRQQRSPGDHEADSTAQGLKSASTCLSKLSVSEGSLGWVVLEENVILQHNSVHCP